MGRWSVAAALALALSVPGPRAQEPTGPPGPGEWIAFVRSSLEGDTAIYVMHADGTEPQQITEGRSIDGVTWSPEGARLAFVDETDNGTVVYLVNPDGTGPVRLTDDATYCASRPTWSPTGRPIAFQSYGQEGDGVYLVDADGTNLRRVPNTGDAWDVCWSADGRRIAVAGYHEPGIYTLDLDGTGRTRLTTTHADEGLAWSPDGTRIAFCTAQEGELRVINTDGTNEHALPLTPNTSCGAPCWSPDAKQIAFMREGDEGSIICVINADGTGLTELTAGPMDHSPAWWGPRPKKRLLGP